MRDRRLPFALPALLLLVAASAAAAPARPNVVIFLADDLGWSDVGYHGEETIRTPSIDRIAREGVQLDRFYTATRCAWAWPTA